MIDVIFVLVEPAVPENIGAAARALKTTGFTQIRLVNPCNHLADEAKWLAHGSNDILEAADVFASLKEALDGVDFAVGTTAKNRSAKADYYTPEAAKGLIFKKSGTISKIAIVFGREESGLTNGELRMCDIASSIPLFAPYPSINLAQSVMIYAYVFSTLKQRINNEPGPEKMLILRRIQSYGDPPDFCLENWISIRTSTYITECWNASRPLLPMMPGFYFLSAKESSGNLINIELALIFGLPKNLHHEKFP
jgi:tRNA/rRNA methyltransferase